MAIANSDGSIILSTKVDTKGIDDFFKKYETGLDGIGKKTKENTESTEDFGKKSEESSKKSKKGFEGLKDTLKGVSTALASAFAIQKIIQFSNESASLATQTEASVQRLVDIYGSASDSVGNFIDQNLKALGLSKSVGASIASTYGNLLSVWADQATNAELTNALLNQTAVVASRTGRTTTDVAERIHSGLLGNTEAIEDLGINVNIKTIEITDAFKRIADGRSWEQLNAYEQAQVRTLAILEQSTNKYGTTVADTSATIRNRFDAAYQDFQNSWGTIVNQVLIPVLQVLTQIFNIATAGFNALSGRSGQILKNSQMQEDASDNTAKNIEEQVDAQKDLNKELNKTTASFDTVQILSSQTAGNTSGGLDSSLQGIGGDLGGAVPDGSAYVDEANAMLTAIMGFVSFAMVAIGVILLLTGHIGWGLGFIIAGAGLLAVTEASVSQEGVGIDVQNALTTALLIAGVAAIVIGIILCMCQQYVKGIALIALGAATVVADIAINWDSIKDMLSDEKVATWVAIGGTIAIVLGILLCFAQQWWAGIGLIALGATALGIDVAVNWNAITEAFTNDKTAKWIAVGGIVAIVLGILLCFAQLWALGIGLIVLGVAAIVAPIVANWDAIWNTITTTFNKIINWIETNGLAMLVLGCILCATGVALPIGLALIAFGIKGMVQGKDPTTNAIVDWVKGAWDAVKGFWNQYIAPIFTAKWWTDLGKTCINGLIAGFEGGINGIIGAIESMINWIVDGLNELSFDVPDWVPGIGGETFGFDISKVDFGRVSIPRLAQGSVIPPNREFLAVLGDNKKEHEIVSPISTMKQAFMEAMIEMGGNFGGGNTEVVLEIDGREFGRAVVEQGNRENRRIGTRLVIA